jgi:hypothetical protein
MTRYIPSNLTEKRAFRPIKGRILMTTNKDKPFTLAKPWILPIIIIVGLASAWAAPWTFGNASTFQIFQILVPLIIQSALSAVTAILAFLGKQIWLGLMIATFAISLANAINFSTGIFGVSLPTTQNIILFLTSLTLIPAFIWGLKKVSYNVTSDVPTWNAENNHSDW